LRNPLKSDDRQIFAAQFRWLFPETAIIGSAHDFPIDRLVAHPTAARLTPAEYSGLLLAWTVARSQAWN
jgi:hypothetical protein